MSRKQFARDHWGARPSLTRSAVGFEDLFSAEAVIAHPSLRAPFVRMATEGATVLSPSLFAAGATLVLQGLHRAWGRSASSPAPWSATSATPQGSPARAHVAIVVY